MAQRDGYRHLTEFRVRFADLDAMGHLNNLAILELLETGRVDYVVDLELGTHAELTYVLVRLECDFRAQAHYRDVLTCGTRIARLGGSSFVVEHDIWNEGGTTVATASSTLVTLGDDPTRAAPIPDDWPGKIERFEGRPVPRKQG